MRDLTEDDIGKEFKTQHGAVFTVILVGNFNAIIENGCVGFLTCSLSGDIDGSDSNLVKRYESRWWLKDLPNADLFDLRDDERLVCSGCLSWGVIHKDAKVSDDGTYWAGGMGVISHIKLPKLTGDEWELSKISIEELKLWQDNNKIAQP